MMKKFFTILIAILVTFSISSCGETQMPSDSMKLFISFDSDGSLGTLYSVQTDDDSVKVVDKDGNDAVVTIPVNVRNGIAKTCSASISSDSSEGVSAVAVEKVDDNGDTNWVVEVKIKPTSKISAGDFIDASLSLKCDDVQTHSLQLTGKILSPFKIVPTVDNELEPPKIKGDAYFFDYGKIDLRNYEGNFVSQYAPYSIELAEGVFPGTKFDITKDVELDHQGDGFIFENQSTNRPNKTNSVFAVAPVVNGLKEGQHAMTVIAKIKLSNGEKFSVKFITTFTLIGSIS